MFTDILNEQGVLSTYIVLQGQQTGQRDWGCCILCKKCKNSFTGEIMFMRWYSPIRVYCRNPRVRTGPRLPVRWSDCPSQWWRDDVCSSLPYWQSCGVRDFAPLSLLCFVWRLPALSSLLQQFIMSGLLAAKSTLELACSCEPWLLSLSVSQVFQYHHYYHQRVRLYHYDVT